MTPAREPWDDQPDSITPVAKACLRIIASRADHGLPEPVARYVRGEADSLPASLGWVPEDQREVLRITREIVVDAACRRREKEAKRQQWGAMFPAPALRQPQEASFEPAIDGDATGTAGDLHVEFCPAYETAYYTGTRAQLEADGLVPQGVEWPTGRGSVRWERGPLHFTLSRAKGREQPADCWRVSVNRPGDFRAAQVRIKARELDRALYEASHEGKRACLAQWRRIEAAQDDARFQSFLGALLPAGVKQLRAPRRKAGTSRTAKEGGGACARG